MSLRSLTCPFMILAGTLAGLPVSAAPLYTVAFESYTENAVFSANPFGRDSVFALPPSNGTGVATGQGYSMQGRVAATHAMDLTWTGGSGSFSSATWAKCFTDDFVISGPAGSVGASLNLRVQSLHSLAGGYANNGGHMAQVVVSAIARQAFWPFAVYAQTSSDLRYTNSGPYGTGVLTGQTGPGVDVPFTLSGTFPVNVPFSVEFRLDARGTGYGNFSTNPGYSGCDAGGASTSPLGAGLRLNSVNGQIMTLPPGYSLNVSSWGIVDNGSTLVGVGDAPAPAGLVLRLSGANPFAGTARVALDLPRSAVARVTVFDMAGRAVRTLADGWLSAGPRELVWDARDADGASVPAGLYFVLAECNGERAAARLARVR